MTNPAIGIAALCATLTDELGEDRSTVDDMAAALMAAGLLSDKGSVTTEHAARLLVGCLATASPLNAVLAVRAYASLPLRHGERVWTDGFTEACERFAVEDIPVAPGQGPSWTRFSRNFVDAMSAMIDFARDSPVPPGQRPTHLAVRRSIGAPMAILAIELPADDPRLSGRYTFALADHEDERYCERNAQLCIWGHLRGSIIQDLGDLLSGRPRGALMPTSPQLAPADAVR